MFIYLILLFTIVPAVELAVLIKIGTYIGVGNTLFLIIATGIIGASLARYQGFSTLRNIQEAMNRGVMPTEEMLNGVMILVGGILLLTPGFITDTFGFSLLIPWTRNLIKYFVKHRMKHMVDEGTMTTFHSHQQKNRPPNDYEDADFR